MLEYTALENTNSLQGKTALITGSNRGIGKKILETFAANGANIHACARSSNDDFLSFLDSVKHRYNVDVCPMFFDLSKENEIKDSLKTLLSNKEQIHILVNNAGIAHGGLLQMVSMEHLREIFEINFFSQMLIIQNVSKIMMRQKYGSIINMASVAGIDANPGYTGYGTSKAALIFATKTLSKELARYNIRINAVAPGLTDTEMADQMEIKAKNMMLESSAMNRLATTDEIANTALFLASESSSFITGQILRVDGGI